MTQTDTQTNRQVLIEEKKVPVQGSATKRHKICDWALPIVGAKGERGTDSLVVSLLSDVELEMKDLAPNLQGLTGLVLQI